MPLPVPTSILVAFGGNAILKERQRGTAEEQFANLEAALEYVADLVQEGHRVIITHGNGPQVGVLMRQGEAAADMVPEMPLDVLVAKTQGQIGYMIQHTLINIFRARQVKRNVVSVITQVVVDASDPAFADPRKRVGRFYDKERAEAMMAADPDLVMKEDAGRGWRRVVPSPEPIDVLEVDFVREAYTRGDVVIACGGGGIPVMFRGGRYRGVEAVVDKDKASAVLAARCDVELFLVLTDVEQVYLDYQEPDQEGIDYMSVEEAMDYLRAGEFSEGSMRPKVEAAIEFLGMGGERVVITSLEKVRDALDGRTGTHMSHL
ncbi:MAG: carbamate kinase [Thermoplasmata archaeon]|nr:MAG: carbamate kinase [Thermoplasmata archaeon]